MTVASAMQSASLRVAGERPTTFFGSSDQLALEMCDLVNDVARDVSEYQDWQRLTRVYSITGDGATETFPMPDDYDRQLINADMQDLQSWAWGYEHITDINDFLYQRQRGMILTPGAWIIYGGLIHFTPSPAGDASFPYISKNYAVGSDQQRKPAFDADTDSFILDEHLLTLGLVWRWREQKKLDFTGDQANFEKALNERGAKDAGSKVIRYGGRMFNRRGASPWVRA